jgi:hypothetical protein
MNRIAIDIDEVLVPFLYPMSRWAHMRCPPKDSAYAYVYRDIFGIQEEESRAMVQGFYRSRDFRVLKPIRGSQHAMSVFRSNCTKMYIVTGRQEEARPETERWIDQHFPGMFDDVILTNSFTPNEIKKVDVCRALNIGLIVDDNRQTCDECIESGMNAIHFVGEEVYPWCEESSISYRGWI